MVKLLSILALCLLALTPIYAGSASHHLWEGSKPKISHNPCQHNIHHDCPISFPDEKIVIVNKTDRHISVKRIEYEESATQPFKHYEICLSDPTNPCDTQYCLHIQDGKETGCLELHGLCLSCKYWHFCGLHEAGHVFFFVPA